MLRTDKGDRWKSTDGKVWENQMPMGAHKDKAVVYCGDAFKDRLSCTLPEGKGVSSAKGGNVWVAIVNGAIQRSTDNGATWQPIAGTNKALVAVAFKPMP